MAAKKTKTTTKKKKSNAKVTKPKAKKAVTATEPIPVPDITIEQEVREGNITVQFSQRELEMLSQLLSAGGNTYEQLAKKSLEVQDTEVAQECAARQQLFNAFASRFATYVKIGEPKSKLVH